MKTKNKKAIKILYVDDDSFNHDLFRLKLSDEFDILQALSGKEGLDILKNTDQIEVVISDFEMPYMNGLEFIRKSKEAFGNLKYYLLSSSLLTEEISNAVKTGLIRKFISKPMNEYEIKNEIRSAFENNNQT